MEATSHWKHPPPSWLTTTSFFEKSGKEIWTPHASATRRKFNDCHISATTGQRDIAFCPYGDYWRQMRKICILELLSAKNVRSFRSIRENEVFHLIESIKSSLGLPINLTKKIFSLTNDITFRAAFGKRYEDKDVLIPLIKESIELLGGFDVCDLFPSLKVLQFLSGMRSKLVRLHRKMDQILENIINEHEENLKSSKGRYGEVGEENLVDVLLRLKQRGGLQFPITNNNIKAIIQIRAKKSTTATTLRTAEQVLHRRTKFGMPNLERRNKATRKDIQKKRKRNDGYYNEPIRSFDQIHGGAGNYGLVGSCHDRVRISTVEKAQESPVDKPISLSLYVG
ncbi:hypothetical protein C3L33_06498, partial [Rhododendron williamsianum]